MTRAFPIPRISDTAQVLAPVDYLRAVRQRWLAVLCAAITGLALAAAYVRYFPDTYNSQAIVRFNPPQVADRYVSANDSMQAEQRLFALTQMLTSAVTARKLIASQGLYPELRRFRTVEDLVPRFQSNLTVKRVNMAGMDPRRALPSLHLSFRYSSPEKARRVLTLMVESIHEANRGYRGDQSNGTTEFLRMQADGVQERILELEAQIADLGLFDRTAGDHEWALKIQQLYSVENRLGHVQTSLRNLNKERADLLNDIADFESRLRRVQATVNAKTELPSVELQGLQRREHEARIAYERLLERYRPDYPACVEARILLDEVSARVREQEARELETARQRARRDLGQKADTLRASLATVDRSIQEQQLEEQTLTRKAGQIRGTTQAGPEDNMEYLRLTREYEVLKEFHRSLVKKQQESNVGSEMERLGRGEAIELVEPPTLPTLASQPVWQFKLVLGFLFGACAAAAAAIFAAVRNPILRCERHLQLWPGLPLLAEIPAVPLALAAPSAAATTPSHGLRVRVRIRKPSWLPLVFLLILAAAAPACSWRGPSAPQLLAQARATEQSGELRKAMVLYRRALARDPKCGDAHDALARLEFDIGEVDRSYSHLLRAVELKPNDLALHLRLAELTYLIYSAADGRSQDNLLELEAISAKIATRWPRRPQGFIYQSLALQERHRTAQAIELLQNAVRQIGPDPSLQTQVASLLHQQGQTAASAALLATLVQQGARYAPAYDLYYLQLMQAHDEPAARRVLAAKWAQLHDPDSGLQFAAHLHAIADLPALDAQLAEVRALQPAPADLLARLGDFWLNRANFPRARALFEEGLRAAPAASLYVTRLAELDEREGLTAQAQTRLRDALARTPSDPLLQAHRAVFDLRNPSESAKARAQLELEMILQRMPRSSFVRYHLGRAYLRIGDVVKAQQQFERCVRLDPNYAPGWLALAESDLDQGYVAAAQSRIDRVLTHAPRLPSALLLKSRIQAARGDFAQAGSTLDSVAALGVSASEIRLRRAELKLLAGAPAEAAQLLEACLREAPADPRILVLLARAEAASGLSAQALARLRSPASQPAAPESLIAEYASLAMAAQQPAAAADAFQRLNARFPTRTAYRTGLADALALLGRPEEAAAHYRAVQQAAPNHLDAWLHFAALRSTQGQFQQARDAYRKALSLAPGNAFVQNNFAYVLARTGDQLDYALELAQEAERMLPASPDIQDTLVYIHARMGMRQQALTTLDRLLARSQPAARAPLAQLRAQVSQGQLEAAARAMEAARDRAHAAGGRS